MEREQVANVTAKSATIRIMLSSDEKSIGLFVEIFRRKPKRIPETVVRTVLSFRIAV
jgi:hypothetical protein